MAPSLSRPVRVETAAAHTSQPCTIITSKTHKLQPAWPTWQPGRRWLPCCPATAARLQQPAHAAQQVQAGIQRCLGCRRLEAMPRRSCLGVHHKLLHRVVRPQQLRSTLGNRSWKVRRGRRGPVSWRGAGHVPRKQVATSLLGSRTRATSAWAAAQQQQGCTGQHTSLCAHLPPGAGHLARPPGCASRAAKARCLAVLQTAPQRLLGRAAAAAGAPQGRRQQRRAGQAAPPPCKQ